MRHISIEQLSQLLEQWRDRTLTPEQQRELEAYLASHPQAQRWWREAIEHDSRLTQALHQLDSFKLPETSYSRIKQRLAAKQRRQKLGRLLLAPILLIALLVGVRFVAQSGLLTTLAPMLNGPQPQAMPTVTMPPASFEPTTEPADTPTSTPWLPAEPVGTPTSTPWLPAEQSDRPSDQPPRSGDPSPSSTPFEAIPLTATPMPTVAVEQSSAQPSDATRSSTPLPEPNVSTPTNTATPFGIAPPDNSSSAFAQQKLVSSSPPTATTCLVANLRQAHLPTAKEILRHEPRPLPQRSALLQRAAFCASRPRCKL